jgi:uncharacterized cupredoxin-like copper-binding protein
MKRNAAALVIGFSALVWAGTGVSGATAAERRVEATTVRVQLKEWRVVLSATRVRSGRVTFVVRNAGKLPHNLVVLRTTRAPARLPVSGSRANEIGRVGKTPVFGPGRTRRLTLRLKAGKYVLICNVPGHYRSGMFVAFRVR